MNNPSDKPSSQSPSLRYPKISNHIAINVTDLNEAERCYTEVFGFTMIREPMECVADDSVLGIVVKDIHGQELRKMRRQVILNPGLMIY